MKALIVTRSPRPISPRAMPSAASSSTAVMPPAMTNACPALSRASETLVVTAAFW